VSREEALRALVQFDQPLTAIADALRQFTWDRSGDPVVQLSTDNVSSVLRRYVGGELTAEELEGWANLLECREDIDAQPVAADAVFELANPVLQGPYSVLVPALLARL
jgi:hypothetical protein